MTALRDKGRAKLNLTLEVLGRLGGVLLCGLGRALDALTELLGGIGRDAGVEDLALDHVGEGAASGDGQVEGRTPPGGRLQALDRVGLELDHLAAAGADEVLVTGPGGPRLVASEPVAEVVLADQPGFAQQVDL